MALTMNTCGVERVFTPPSEGFTTTFMRIGLTPPVSLLGSDGDYFWNDGNNAYYSNGSKQYVLNKKLFDWEEKTWGGLTSFSANNIWTDGTNIYYSLNDEQYVLNGAQSTRFSICVFTI